MTSKEFAQLASAIKTFFPRDNVLPTPEAMGLWFDMLKDLDYASASMALKNHVASSRFAPTVADIREKATALSKPQELNEMEAWALVSKALRNSAYHNVEEFEKLPPLVQKAVGQPSQLKAWATEEGFSEDVVSSNFIKCYRIVKNRSDEFSRLPERSQALLTEVDKKSYSAQITARTLEVAERLSSSRDRGNLLAIQELTGTVPMPERCNDRLKKLGMERA